MPDDFLEFGERDLMILYLDVDPNRLPVLHVTDVDISGTFDEELMKSALQKPDG